MFEEEIDQLESLLKVLKSKKNTDDEVLTIVETWIEMLTRFPEAVAEIDLGTLHEFMAEKSEQFYEQFKCDNGFNIGEEIVIEQNATYIYHWASISLIKGPITQLYPFMLVRASNYSGFIEAFCNRLKSVRESFKSFFNIFIALNQSGKPKLSEYDIKLIKEGISLEFQSRKQYNEVTRKFLRKKNLQRLVNLKVVAFFHAVNFSPLGLVPYIHLANDQALLPENFKPFVEKQFGRPRMYRLFLLPIEKEKEWADSLNQLGKGGKLEEWSYHYSLDLLKFKNDGSWEWELDFPILGTNHQTSQKFDLLAKCERPKRLTPGLVSFLDAVHRYESATPEEIAAITGLSSSTAWTYFYIGFDSKIILPYWHIGRIGLDSYYQILFKNDLVNQKLEKFLEGFPKVMIMKSENICLFTLYLPVTAIEKLENFLKTGEEEKSFSILAKGSLLIDQISIDKGVKLDRLWKAKILH
ncbi:MAG: hypothetical protein ACFFD4_20670 [Candidatus Odinarchaeota archaeon]